MLEMAISIKDLGAFFIFLALMCALIYLIITLRKVSDLLGSVNKVISQNEAAIADITESVRNSLNNADETVPGILRNVEGITGSVNNSAKSLDTSIATVGSGIVQTVAAVQESASDIGTYITIAMEAARVVKGFMAQTKGAKKKKGRWVRT